MVIVSFAVVGWIIGILLFLLTVLYRNRAENRRIRDLAEYLEQVNNGKALILETTGEDDFSKLEDEIYKTVTSLYQTKDQAVHAKNDFAENLSNIAHQIKTPITAISLASQRMKQDFQHTALEQVEKQLGDTYIINEEQAETVRMIYDLYLQGYGSMKIAKILTERKRKTASGLVKWSVSNIMRAIRNATYTGTKCYNKSRSNNFLEQKRINNLDMSTYEYVEGDFPAIVSQEVWDKAQKIRESGMKPSLVSSAKTTHSKRDSKDIWVNKLRCSCRSSYRKNKWHTKKDGGISYGYQCYNQLNKRITPTS